MLDNVVYQQDVIYNIVGNNMYWLYTIVSQLVSARKKNLFSFTTTRFTKLCVSSI